jgi:hypothetical protein
MKPTLFTPSLPRQFDIASDVSVALPTNGAVSLVNLGEFRPELALNIGIACHRRDDGSDIFVFAYRFHPDSPSPVSLTEPLKLQIICFAQQYGLDASGRHIFVSDFVRKSFDDPNLCSKMSDEN